MMFTLYMRTEHRLFITDCDLHVQIVSVAYILAIISISGHS